MTRTPHDDYFVVFSPCLPLQTPQKQSGKRRGGRKRAAFCLWMCVCASCFHLASNIAHFNGEVKVLRPWDSTMILSPPLSHIPERDLMLLGNRRWEILGRMESTEPNAK